MSVAREFFDLRMAGLYLPSVTLLIIRPTVSFLYPLVFLSLLGAVFFHGLSRNVFGVGGPEENPMERSEAVQGIQVAVSGKGPHSNLPETPLGMVLNILFNPFDYGISAVILMVVGVISLLSWFPSLLLSVYFGIKNFHYLGTGPQLVVFAEFVWILQWIVWRFFSPSYLLDEDDFE